MYIVVTNKAGGGHTKYWSGPRTSNKSAIDTSVLYDSLLSFAFFMDQKSEFLLQEHNVCSILQALIFASLTHH